MAERKVCAHATCECSVDGGDLYCSDVCKQTVEQDPGGRGACRCGHPDCKAA